MQPEIRNAASHESRLATTWPATGHVSCHMPSLGVNTVEPQTRIKIPVNEAPRVARYGAQYPFCASRSGAVQLASLRRSSSWMDAVKVARFACRTTRIPFGADLGTGRTLTHTLRTMGRQNVRAPWLQSAEKINRALHAPPLVTPFIHFIQGTTTFSPRDVTCSHLSSSSPPFRRVQAPRAANATRNTSHVRRASRAPSSQCSSCPAQPAPRAQFPRAPQ